MKFCHFPVNVFVGEGSYVVERDPAHRVFVLHIVRFGV